MVLLFLFASMLMLLSLTPVHGERTTITITDFKDWLESSYGDDTESGSVMLDDLQDQKDEVTRLIIDVAENKPTLHAAWAIGTFQLDPKIALPLLSEIINGANDEPIRYYAMRSLVLFGKPGVDELISVIEKKGKDFGLACGILLDTISEYGSKAAQIVDVDRLVGYASLETTKASSRAAIAEALTCLDGEENELFIRILKDVDLTVGFRSFAALTISGKVDADVVEYMLGIICNTEIEAELRTCTLASIVRLRQLDIERVSKVLITALRDKDDQVQRAAAILLAEISTRDEVIDALADAIVDTERSTQARVNAVYALKRGFTRNVKATDALNQAIRSREPAIRNEVFMVLRMIGQPVSPIDWGMVLKALGEGELKDRFNAVYTLARTHAVSMEDRMWAAKHPETKLCLPILIDVLKDDSFNTQVLQAQAAADSATQYNAPDWITGREFFRWGNPRLISHKEAFDSIGLLMHDGLFSLIGSDSLYKLLGIETEDRTHYFPYDIEGLLKKVPPACQELAADSTLGKSIEVEVLDLDSKAVKLNEKGEGLYMEAMKNKNMAQAIKGVTLMEEALALEPRISGAYLNLGQYYSLIGAHSDALHLVRKGMKYCPNDCNIFFALGNIYSNMDRHMLAAHAFWGAISLGEVSASAYYNLANAIRQMGDIEKAIAIYHRAVEFDPKHLGARRNLAIIYGQTEDTASAVEQLKILARLDPNGKDGEWAKKVLSEIE